MEAKNFRLGNWYQSKNGFEYQVEHDDFTNWYVNGCLAEPIQLDQEWLENLGFICHDFESDEPEWLVLKWGTSNLFYADASTDFSVVTTNHKVLGDITIKYVHELQNLFFTLTGEELKLKKLKW